MPCARIKLRTSISRIFSCFAKLLFSLCKSVFSRLKLRSFALKIRSNFSAFVFNFRFSTFKVFIWCCWWLICRSRCSIALLIGYIVFVLSQLIFYVFIRRICTRSLVTRHRRKTRLPPIVGVSTTGSCFSACALPTWHALNKLCLILKIRTSSIPTSRGVFENSRERLASPSCLGIVDEIGRRKGAKRHHPT